MRWYSALALSFVFCLPAFEAICASEEKIETERQTIAVLPFDYVDTSGEVIDQSAIHEKRAANFVNALKETLAATGKYRIVEVSCGTQHCSPKMAPDVIRKAATDAGARFVIVGGIHKMSTLVQWGKIQVIDEQEGRVLFDKLISFRGDNDEAWKHAREFVTSDLLAADFTKQRFAEAAKPVKLVVFPFELLDFSGGANVIAESEQDRKALEASTDAARKLIASSGRYSLIDEAALENSPARSLQASSFRECGGCEARIARELGAEQSFLGIVTRITRTDYAVTYRLRDANSGELISVGQTDLRIGANYSWDRGAVWLIKNEFLKRQY